MYYQAYHVIQYRDTKHKIVIYVPRDDLFNPSIPLNSGNKAKSMIEGNGFREAF
jgi:hypothetical protein